jgi:hypothetical protein
MVAIVITLVVALSARDSDDTLGDLAWMAGYWTSSDTEGKWTIEELWLPPAAGRLMVGAHRDVRNNRRVFFEYLRIEARGDGVYYVSKPSNQDEAAFRLTEHSPGVRAVFENLEHDFPQRITYTLDGDVLTASISGTIEGKEKSSAWTFHRTPFDKETQ